MDRSVSFYLAYIYKSFFAYSSEKLKKIGVNFGWLPFIIFVGKFPGCSQGELKSKLNVDWGHSQRVIDKLIANDILIKNADINDKRLYHLYLTKKGEEAFKISHEVFHSWDNEKLNGLEEEEKKELLRILKKLTNE